MKQPRKRPSENSRTPKHIQGLLTFVLLASMAVVPLLVQPHFEDAFRLPKEIFLRAEAIIVAALLTLEIVRYGNIRKLTSRKQVSFLLVGAIVVWSGLTTLFSTNRVISGATFGRIVVLSILFVGTMVVARRLSPASVLIVLAPAMISAGIFFLEEFQIWHPFVTPEQIRTMLAASGRNVAIEVRTFNTAFLGNSNDFGDYFALAAVIAAAMLPLRRYRWFLIPFLASFIVALLLNNSIVAVAAMLVGITTVFTLISPRLGVGVACTLVISVLATGLLYPPQRVRAAALRDAVAKRDWNVLLSNRLPSFYAALAMSLDHPLTGVGPGCFAYQYVPYRQHIEVQHVSLLGAGEVGTNFGEVHNDYLQALSESGPPGLALMISALVLLASQSFCGAELDRGSQRAAVARNLALPLAATFGVLALGHFPMELAPPMSLMTFLAPLCIRWREESDD